MWSFAIIIRYYKCGLCLCLFGVGKRTTYTVKTDEKKAHILFSLYKKTTAVLISRMSKYISYSSAFVNELLVNCGNF